MSEVELENIRREIVEGEGRELEEGQQTSEEQSNDTREERESEENLSNDIEIDDKGIGREEIAHDERPDCDEDIRVEIRNIEGLQEKEREMANILIQTMKSDKQQEVVSFKKV